MAAVHYYLGRPARVWISAHSRRSPARQARNGSGRVRSGIPGQPASGFTPSVPAAAHGSADTCSRCAGNRKSSVTATCDLPPDAAPAGGLLARHRIAIARFGTDVAAAGGIGPALAAGLDPADYPVVPGGVPQAWERAKVYLGLCERYQELYQAQVAELHLLMASAPGCSLPLSHRGPLTDPLTDTHTGYISLIRARRGAATHTTRLSCITAVHVRALGAPSITESCIEPGRSCSCGGSASRATRPERTRQARGQMRADPARPRRMSFPGKAGREVVRSWRSWTAGWSLTATLMHASARRASVCSGALVR